MLKQVPESNVKASVGLGLTIAGLSIVLMFTLKCILQ